MSQIGALALVGSGEYTDAMFSIERNLIETGVKKGKAPTYVQFATAAGKESRESIEYWKNLGRKQAERIGCDWKFIEVFDLNDALNQKWIEEIKNSALIYFSGGNPHHLYESLQGTQLWEAIKAEFKTGTSLAGCSAGAMVLGDLIALPFKNFGRGITGLGLVGNLVVLPHYDKYFSRIPSVLQRLMLPNGKKHSVIGVDENTALIHENGWSIVGKSGVHHISSEEPNSYFEGDNFDLELAIKI